MKLEGVERPVPAADEILDALLSYSDRFYHRQFITREKANYQVLDRLRTVLDDYFHTDAWDKQGLPTVQYMAD